MTNIDYHHLQRQGLGIDRLIWRAVDALLFVIVLGLLITVSWQALSRLVGFSAPWTEELSRFLFIWMIMLGAMIGIREHTHFEVDVWPELSPRADAALRIVSGLGVLVFALVFVWWGIQFVRFGWDQTSELAELPMPFIFVAWPLTGITWLVFLGESMWTSFNVLRAVPAE